VPLTVPNHMEPTPAQYGLANQQPMNHQCACGVLSFAGTTRFAGIEEVAIDDHPPSTVMGVDDSERGTREGSP